MRALLPIALALVVVSEPALALELSTPPGSGGGGGGGVSSVGIDLPSDFTCTGSPVTSAGTINCSYASAPANEFLAAPSGGSGTLGLRALVGADLPTPTGTTLGGIKSIAQTAHQWIAYIDSAGTPHLLQPGFADLSGALSLAQLPAIGDGTVLGNNSGASGMPSALTMSQALDMLGSAARGDLLYEGADGWMLLAPGTDGNCLITGGAGADPSWGACGAGGGISGVTAGTNLSGGGTSGSVTLNVVGSPNFAGTVTVQGGLVLNTRTISSGTADAAGAGDYTIAWNSADAGAKTESIAACSAAIKGQIYIIKDEAQTAATYSITVAPAGGTVEGGTTAVISSNGAALEIQCDGGSNWNAI